jgi:hypothetical protein
MRNRMRPYGVALVAAALASATGACRSPSGPAPSAAAFVLRAVGEQELPAVLSHTAGGRLIEVVGGALRLETLVANGAVTGHADLRITDHGAEPRVERRAVSGVSVRRGDLLEVRYATGARETFVVEGGAAALRTVAASCAPAAPCLDILRFYRYERAATAEP